jgi:RHS repeat-associated protein
LGNNKGVTSAPISGTLLYVDQITEYYPFGLPIYSQSISQEMQPYKFGGKELDEMHGLNWYDQGARSFDAIVPRTPTMDPLAEKYYSSSPYALFGNNPVRYVDPDGRSPLSALRGVRNAYKFYRYQRAAQAIRTAQATNAALGATAAASSVVVYNHYVDGDKSAEVLQALTRGVNLDQSMTQNATATTREQRNEQDKRGRKAQAEQDKQQANVQQKVINGGHNPQDSGGDFNPNNPDPNKGVKVVAGVVAVGVGLEQIETNGDSKQNPTPQPRIPPEPSLWDRIKDFLNF